mgnify:CR=1 FL=1
MNALRIVQELADRGGQNVHVAFRRKAKTLKTNPPPFKIEKQTVGVFRAGIDYENRSAVAEKREAGIETQGLKGKTWELFPYILKSEASGKLLLRLNPSSGETRSTVQWFANGQPVTKAEVAPYLLSSETAEKTVEKGEFCFDVGCENIVAIGEKIETPLAYL